MAKITRQRDRDFDLIEIKIKAQTMDDDFDRKMDEAHRQQRLAYAAPQLLKSLEAADRLILQIIESTGIGLDANQYAIFTEIAEAIANAKGE